MIDALNQTVTRPIHTAAAQRAQTKGAEPLPVGRDAVELSDAARSELESGGIRGALVDRVKAEIAADKYLSDDKLNIAIDRLHARLFAR